MFDYHNKHFIYIGNSDNRDITNETLFYFKQYGDIVQVKYYGGNVKFGELIGLVNEQGILQASFHHASASSQFYGGVCTLTPDKGKNHPLRLEGKWWWADGKSTEGESLMEELPQHEPAFTDYMIP